MAVSKNLTTSERRWMFGANVALNVVLAVVLLAIALWAARRVGGQVDLTSAGLNSLSPRTVQLLKGLDQDVTITALYSTALKEIRPNAEKDKARVADLLDLYDSAGGAHVTTHVIDPSESPTAATELLTRLREKPAYKGEAAAHIDALNRYPDVEKAITKLAQSELDALKGLLANDPALGQLNETPVIERRFSELIRDCEDTLGSVQSLQTSETPRYADAIGVVRDNVTLSQQVLQVVSQWMKDEGVGKPNLKPETRTFFAGAAERYAAVQKDIETLLADTANLKTPEFESILKQINAGQVILVETPDKVTVLPEYDVFPVRRDSNGPNERDFAGEQEISSAILRMTQKDRTAVVFVRFGGMPVLESMQPSNPMMAAQMPQAPYSQMNELLKKENFVTAEWDVQASTTPPKVEDTVRTVYVVLPPPPPPSPSMGQPPTPPMSDAQKQAVIDAVNASGMATFLVGWQRPSSPFGGAASYPYGDYLRTTWGIDAKTNFVAMHFRPHPQKDGLFMPRFNDELILNTDSFRLTDQPITEPLQALPCAFAAVAPLEIVTGDAAPAGVKVEPLVVVDERDDVWAFSDLMRIQQEFNKDNGTRFHEDDLPAPFPIAVAASQDDKERLVVFGSEQIATNAMLNAGQLMFVGGRLVRAQLYPANQDLFINTLHWLSGDANRIAVGPRRGEVPRLDKLKEGAAETFWKWFIVGIWPGCALLAGVVVWLTRRR